MTRSALRATCAFFVPAVVVLASCSKGGGTDPTGQTGNESSTPAKVVVTPTTGTLDWISATLQMSASVLSSTGLSLSTSVTWSSSGTSVATVSSSGLVTAKGLGTTTVTAKAGSVSGNATITVRQVPATVTKISGDAQVGTVGETLPKPLVLEVRDQGNVVVPGAVLTWAVVTGGGTLVTSSSETDASGRGQSTWRLGSTLGGQGVQVSAGSAGPVTFDATAAAPEVDRVTLLPEADTVAAVGDTARFVATAYAANGDSIPTATLTFSVTDASVASVSADGLVTAVAPGTTTVIATSGAKADTSAFVVLPPAVGTVTLTSTTPVVLLEGQAATVHGTGFSPTPADNTVTVGGLAATVTAATTTALTVTVPSADCLPPRRTSVSVTAGGKSASLTVGVSPLAQADLDLPVYYYRYTSSGSGCVYLPGNAAGGSYLIGVMSTSQTPSSLTAVSLEGTAGDGTVVGVSPAGTAPGVHVGAARTGMLSRSVRGTPVAPPFAAAPPAALAPVRSHVRAQAQGDVRMTERNLALRAALGPAPKPSRPTRAPAGAPAVGDVITLKSGHSRTCTTGTTIQATVRYVGNSTIWLDDNDNPSGTFTDAELSTLDAFYDANTKPVHDAYFGGLSDVNGDGRIYILMTKEVNKAGLGGWVWWGDLYSTSACATSNFAEIFFGEVPDPGGIYGSAMTKQDVLDYYPLLLTHEITHLVQANAAVFGSAGSKKTWELEGGAQLAVQLVAYRKFGQGSGQDLGYTQYQAGQYWYWNAWLSPLLEYFGWNSDTGNTRVSNAPEECSWLGTSNEGNTGPCEGLFVYGVPPMVFRFALDRWGATYAGGEQGLMQHLTTSSYGGWSSLTDASGWSIEHVLADFYAALWADGRMYNAAGMTSWNLYDIFQNLPAYAQLQPHGSSSTSPQLSANVRGGSNLYLYWTPIGSLAPTAIKVTSSGAPVPSTIAVWALRLK